MRGKFIRYFSGLILLFPFFFLGCIKSINLPFRAGTAQLVVEGSISTDPPPNTVKLSYSGRFWNTYQAGYDSSQSFITDARIMIEDDLGDSTPLTWVINGTYESQDSNFVGIVGRTYTLKIYLSSGLT